MDDAGLPWINTSPNMRSLTEAALYPGIGILERAVSVGRGTATPFEVIGAPWIDADVLAAELTAMALPGIRFEPAHFTPTAMCRRNGNMPLPRAALLQGQWEIEVPLPASRSSSESEGWTLCAITERLPASSNRSYTFK